MVCNKSPDPTHHSHDLSLDACWSKASAKRSGNLGKRRRAIDFSQLSNVMTRQGIDQKRHKALIAVL